MKTMILIATFLSATAYAGPCRLVTPVRLDFDSMGRHDYQLGRVDHLPPRYANYPNGRLNVRIGKVWFDDGALGRRDTGYLAAAVSDGASLGFGFGQVYNGGRIEGSIAQAAGEQVFTFAHYQGPDNQFKSEFRMTTNAAGWITSLEMWLANGSTEPDHVCLEAMQY